jgi:hypothetical protein
MSIPKGARRIEASSAKLGQEQQNGPTARSLSLGCVQHKPGEKIMTKFVTALALAGSLAALAAAAPATAATVRHQNVDRSYEVPTPGPGYYEGEYEFNADQNDRASSPYSDGAGG